MRDWTKYLEENNVILTEMTIELMVDKCIKEGKTKLDALTYATSNDFPVQVSEILKRLPKSFFESMVEADVNFETLMEEYEGDLTQMIDDYLMEDEDEDTDDKKDYSNKFDEDKPKSKKKKISLDDKDMEKDDDDTDDEDDKDGDDKDTTKFPIKKK